MSMKLVRTNTFDGMELQGLLAEGKENKRNLVLHIHGTWGNFYGNHFIDYFSEEYPCNGYSFLSANTRGHDDGSISERFEDCVADIDQWLKFAKENGYEKFILQGHSLGALKAIYYIRNRVDPSIEKIILLSPFDSIAFYCSGRVQTREKILSAIEKVMEGSPANLVPRDVWSMWLISAGTLFDILKKDTIYDIFPFRKGNLKNSPLSNINKPTLVAIGGNDFAAFPNPKGEYEQLLGLTTVHSVFIPDAPHNFAGYENQLLKSIFQWLKQ